MFIYYYDNSNGIISYGNSSGLLVNNLIWQQSNDILIQTNGSFYLRVNGELCSKTFTKNSQKMYNYPGVYSLKCFYDNLPSMFFTARVTVNDGIKKVTF
jgi:hypothetical protein